MNDRIANNIWLKVIGIIVLAVIAFVVIREQTKVNAKSITENRTMIKKCVDDRIQEQLQISIMKSDVKHIKEDVAEMKIEQRATKTIVERIERKL